MQVKVLQMQLSENSKRKLGISVLYKNHHQVRITLQGVSGSEGKEKVDICGCAALYLELLVLREKRKWIYIVV